MTTEWYLKRSPSTELSTHGVLTTHDSQKIFTLEDPEREIKIPKKTAIPKGRYRLMITYSEKFKRDLPLLIDVPGYSGVRIHSGNKPEHTDGCILVGLSKEKDQVLQSKDAMIIVMVSLMSALKQGDVYLNIQ